MAIQGSWKSDYDTLGALVPTTQMISHYKLPYNTHTHTKKKKSYTNEFQFTEECLPPRAK